MHSQVQPLGQLSGVNWKRPFNEVQDLSIYNFTSMDTGAFYSFFHLHDIPKELRDDVGGNLSFFHSFLHCLFFLFVSLTEITLLHLSYTLSYRIFFSSFVKLKHPQLYIKNISLCIKILPLIKIISEIDISHLSPSWRSVLQVNAWITKPKAITPLHYDVTHNSYGIFNLYFFFFFLYL